MAVERIVGQRNTTEAITELPTGAVLVDDVLTEFIKLTYPTGVYTQKMEAVIRGLFAEFHYAFTHPPITLKDRYIRSMADDRKQYFTLEFRELMERKGITIEKLRRNKLFFSEKKVTEKTFQNFRQAVIHVSQKYG